MEGGRFWGYYEGHKNSPYYDDECLWEMIAAEFWDLPDTDEF